MRSVLFEMFIGEAIDDSEWRRGYESYLETLPYFGGQDPPLSFEEWKETMEDYYGGIEKHFGAPGEDPRKTMQRVVKSMSSKPNSRS